MYNYNNLDGTWDPFSESIQFVFVFTSFFDGLLDLEKIAQRGEFYFWGHDIFLSKKLFIYLGSAQVLMGPKIQILSTIFG